VAAYTISDEPRPSKLRHLVFHPSGPLLASMLGGAWLAWPWFVLNSIALGSPTRRKEIAIAIVAVLGSLALAVLVVALDDAKLLETKTRVELAILGITVWKLGCAYWVCIVQSRTFHVYTYYGGTARPVMVPLLVGFALRSTVMGLVAHPLWWITVGM